MTRSSDRRYARVVSRALEALTGRVGVALAVMVGAVLAAVLPVMSASTADAPGMTAAVLALAVTALFTVAMHRVSLQTRVRGGTPSGC
jgi:hypothetical protein